MKILKGKTNAGNTLILVLFTTAMMGLSLASYLVFVRNQNLAVMRSLAWNTCIPVIEAGIEEAITHVNCSGLTNLNSAGWLQNGSYYTKTRYLGSSYYVVSISASDPPVIVSDGYVPVPANPTMSFGFLAAAGVDQQSTTRFNSRKVRVTTRKDGIWTKAMVAKGNIDLKGNNITTDSFDSSNTSYSTNGRYDASKRKANGDVATNSRLLNSLNVGNADLWGRGSTGPGGSVAIGANGSIGDLAWHQAHSSGIQPGWTTDDMNVAFPDVTAPFTTGFSPQSGSLGSTSFAYLLNGGASGADYVIGDLSLTGSQVMLITNRVRLLVTGTINIKGNGAIRVAQNSSLELYMQGASAAFGGNGVANDTGYAINFQYLGLPTHTSLSFGGYAAFTGVIYAPSADFSLGGGGSDTLDFIGASVTKTVTMNGHFNFHYDEALGNTGLARGYIITGWNEI